MAKKKTSLSTSNMFTWDVSDYLRECYNVVRWNPRLAIDWMEYTALRVTSEIHTQAFNKVAKRMNDFLDNLENRRYYRKEDYWENDRVRRVSFLRVYDDILPDEDDEDEPITAT